MKCSLVHPDSDRDQVGPPTATRVSEHFRFETFFYLHNRQLKSAPLWTPVILFRDPVPATLVI